jgi:hypothetical protein
MFPYDGAIRHAVSTEPQTVDGVLAALEAIDGLFGPGDGLKWFNWLYLAVTKAVKARVANGGFADPAWLAELDVRFARLYLSALRTSLGGGKAPGCWEALFTRRGDTRIARIQFALAGINAHINHDLAAAVVDTWESAGVGVDGTETHYQDYTSVNSTLDSLVEDAKKTLHVRLLGDALPAASTLEDTAAAWNVCAARETAWRNAQHLWNLRAVPGAGAVFLDGLDGFATVIGKVLLVPV